VFLSTDSWRHFSVIDESGRFSGWFRDASYAQNRYTGRSGRSGRVSPGRIILANYNANAFELMEPKIRQSGGRAVYWKA
jgi:hypothetical protein